MDQEGRERERERDRERERETERPSLLILIYNVFTKTFTTRLSACLAERLTDATHAHAHTHTQTETAQARWSLCRARGAR